jgi:hypothetical protein
VLVATLPDVGPCHARDKRPCVVRLHHLRERSTGPCLPLAVLRCWTHSYGFTLYPPGFVPYSRLAVAPVALDGTEAVAGVEAFAGTLLDATLDAAKEAAKDAAWARACKGGSSTWWSTQGRHIWLAVRLCGVAPDLKAAARQAQAAALWVEMLLLLLQGAQSIGSAPGYRSRGRAAVAVLERVAAGPCVLQRVLAAGHLAGLWGAPWRWDEAGHRLRPWAFRGDGTRPP